MGWDGMGWDGMGWGWGWGWDGMGWDGMGCVFSFLFSSLHLFSFLKEVFNSQTQSFREEKKLCTAIDFFIKLFVTALKM
jgi:hypothetical protein